MPKQIGNMPVVGTMNNMSYYKSKDGIMVKMKSEIPKDKFKGKNFEITRKNNLEFGLAGKASKALRHAIRPILLNCKDSRLASRLTALMLKIAKTDVTSVHGERNVSKGQLDLLNGFDFNANAAFAGNFAAPYTININRATGVFSIDIPSFNPATLLPAPEGATHFKLVSAGCEVDFEKEVYATQTFESADLPVSGVTADIHISHANAANSVNPLLLILGVQFYLEVNGTKTLIRNNSFSPMAILKVDIP